MKSTVVDARAFPPDEIAACGLPETVPALLWAATADGVLCYVNRRVVEYTGRSLEEHVRVGWTRHVHPDDLDEALRKWTHAVRSASSYRAMHRLRGADGSYRWFLAQAEPSRDADGRVTRFFGIHIDIDESVRREEELQRSRAYLAETQKSSHTGSWAWSPASNTILYWSDECYRILGYDPAQGIPSFESTWERIHPEDRLALGEAIERGVRDEADFEVEYRLLLPDGRMRNVRILAHPVKDASGALGEFIGTVVDVTEQKRAEEERRGHLWFLESMDRINRAMQRTNDFELMMGGVLEEALAIFGCERACLVYPCDPDAPTWRVVVERATPQYAGDFALDEDFPTSHEGVEMFRRVLGQRVPLADPELPADRRARFHIASMITFAVRPRGDRPYLFAMHQCSGPRAWTAAERRLFEEIARRLEDTLTSALSHRSLLASQEELCRSRAYLAEAQKVSHTGSWAWDNVAHRNLYWSEECYRIHGRDPAQGLPSLEQVMEDIHPDDRTPIAQSLEKALRAGTEWEGEYRLVNFAEPRIIRTIAHPVADSSGQVREYIGTVVDVTEQKRAEEERRQNLWFLECIDRINRAMQRTNDAERMMSDVLAEILAIFGCDRAWLVYPCDPDAPTWRAVMEHTRPGYPGAFALGHELPVDREVAEVFRRALEDTGAVTDLPIPGDLRERFNIWSVVAIAVHPKGDRPYLLGLHQCSAPRQWTCGEARLLEEIAPRLADALTSLLAHRSLLASQEALRASEQRFRTFADHATDAFFLLDDEAIVRDVNRQACESLGRVREELIGMHAGQFAAGATPEKVARKIEEAWEQLRTYGHTTVNTLFCRKDASTFPVEVRVRAFTRGGRTWALALASDITERRRREQRLLAQYRVTQVLSDRRSLEDAAPRILRAMCDALEWEFGALWRVDPEQGVLRCLGAWPPESELERDVHELAFIPGEGLPGRAWTTGVAVFVRDMALEAAPPSRGFAARHGIHASIAFPIRSRGGVLAVMQFFSRELRDADGELLQTMAAIGFQLGEFVKRTRVEEALARTREELAQASRMATVAELSASVAHEINQPLQAVVAHAHACLRWLDAAPPNVDKARHTAERIVRDANGVADVVARIRALFRHTAPAKIDLDLNDLILQICALMSDEMHKHAISLEMQLAEDLPRVGADPVQIQQVLLNLVRNAIESMAATVAGARPLLLRSRRDEGHVAVDVRDAGLAPADVEKIFEPFFTTKETGMGMGLAISRSIVEAHGGRIWVARNRDRGVTFSFSLPSNP